MVTSLRISNKTTAQKVISTVLKKYQVSFF
jgi:hypothetical protein